MSVRCVAHFIVRTTYLDSAEYENQEEELPLNHEVHNPFGLDALEENIGELNLQNINQIHDPPGNPLDNLEHQGELNGNLDDNSDEEDQFNNLPHIADLLAEIANLDAAQPMEIDNEMALKNEENINHLPMVAKIVLDEFAPEEIIWSEELTEVAPPDVESEDIDSAASLKDDIGMLNNHAPTTIIANHDTIPDLDLTLSLAPFLNASLGLQVSTLPLSTANLPNPISHEISNLPLSLLDSYTPIASTPKSGRFEVGSTSLYTELQTIVDATVVTTKATDWPKSVSPMGQAQPSCNWANFMLNLSKIGLEMLLHPINKSFSHPIFAGQNPSFTKPFLTQSTLESTFSLNITKTDQPLTTSLPEASNHDYNAPGISTPNNHPLSLTNVPLGNGTAILPSFISSQPNESNNPQTKSFEVSPQDLHRIHQDLVLYIPPGTKVTEAPSPSDILPTVGNSNTGHDQKPIFSSETDRQLNGTRFLALDFDSNSEDEQLQVPQGIDLIMNKEQYDKYGNSSQANSLTTGFKMDFYDTGNTTVNPLSSKSLKLSCNDPLADPPDSPACFGWYVNGETMVDCIYSAGVYFEFSPEPNPKATTGVAVENFVPPSGWTEDSICHYLLVDLPGFRREEVKLEANDQLGQIMVNGERQVNEKNMRFHQTFHLPENSDIQNISAQFEGGILSVSIPKKAIEENEEQEYVGAVGAEEESAHEERTEDEEESAHEERTEDENLDKDHDKEGNGNDNHHDQVERLNHKENFLEASKEGLKQEAANLLKRLIENLSKNKGIVITAVLAFSLGLLVSSRYQSGGM
ncbi:hypothetical protein RJ640_005379 [Escallonia rubra]|uniref:SHSP domain-containing protein n=1 Tax=Escallonia rubra TaxID=112253 RepID=A0AA88R888_9ASTE|nr:hypothetical protein RJ640_005379 [Escallonia rubra]